MTKKELVGCIAGIAALLSLCFGAYFWVDTRYAHANDMLKAMKSIELLGVRLDLKIIEDQLNGVQQRIWKIEDRYCADKSKPCDQTKMPQTVFEQYRELQCQKEKLQKELEALNTAKR